MIEALRDAEEKLAAILATAKLADNEVTDSETVLAKLQHCELLAVMAHENIKAALAQVAL